MASRASLNKVLLIGNLTRDPELRYTPSGAAVCSFGLATNRVYVASDGTKKEEAEFIRIVSWNKLAELCSQLLTKGRKVYVEGRLQTRNWETPDGQSRQITEVVIDDMRILDSRRSFEEGSQHNDIEPEHKDLPETDKGDHISSGLQEEKLDKSEKQPAKKSKIKKSQTNDSIKADSEIKDDQKVDLEDLPF
ncbi:hypothetical protein A3A48_02720 [Candidatus Curtissbacteria bacterium RIFCSPLOWO2_01_FULL_37_9]|uniref:Single-stranded DNA-binding protein n=1 Tax=Candidatus Curtissbacteria bacterium RIFCSPLOWO2_01_FULL_37_9 TaxID=1797724 RepID=A0A1F5GUU5_9BACT|nr:MAG: hypothetical protein A3A48_02720 [Candidatus Curtissbacteria bacterium RIFCSPLOWO2_01_FULL_37_9]